MKRSVLALLLVWSIWAGNAQDGDSYGLAVGELAPDFTVSDLSGERFQLAKAWRTSPVLLVFYRGGWCPYCNRQLQRLQQKVMPVAEKLGVEVVAISVDRPKYGKESVAAHSLTMRLVSDQDADLLKAYRVVNSLSDDSVEALKKWDHDLEDHSGRQHHIIAIPAVLVVGKGGEVIYSFANQDYQVRAPENEVNQALETAARGYQPITKE